jgi:L-iditol 2-dehydrogenase
LKALVLVAPRQFDYTDIPIPEPKPDEVLIAVRACGICGSDVHGMDGSTGRRRPPIVMGHEASGYIEEVGDEVTGWGVGDRVTFDSTIYCGTCAYCRAGRVNLCDNRRVLGVSCAEYRQHGAFAEYVAVPQRVLYRLPDALSFEHAAMAEPVSIALHALSRSNPQPGEAALVVGAGMIGLLIVQALRLAGCAPIIAVDVDPAKLALAQSMGATHTLNPTECNAVAEIVAATNGQGVDHAFEAVGMSQTVETAMKATRKGGTVTLVGNLSPEISFPLQHAVTRELTLYGSCASSGEYPRCLDLIASGAIDVAPLISATAPLAEGAQWFERLYKKEPGLMKVMLCP